MKNKALELQIKQLIAKDELEQAIQLLSAHFHNNSKLDEILLQSARYHSLLRDQRKGIVDYLEVRKTLNLLRADVLAFLKLELTEERTSVSEEVSKEVAEQEKPISISQKLRLSLARLSVLWILKKENNSPKGVTISGIHKKSKTKSRKNIYESIVEMEQGALIEKNKIGNRTYWKLTEKGKNLAEEFETAFLFSLKEN